MTTTATVVNPDGLFESDFMVALATQIKNSPLCPGERVTGAAVFAPMLRDKGAAAPMPCAVVDQSAWEKINVFSLALAAVVEKECGHIASCATSVSPQGFGRSLITVGKLVVVDKPIRDVNTFGFVSLGKLKDEADKLLSVATTLIGDHSAVAGL